MNRTTTIISLALASAMTFSPMLAFAEDSANVDVSASTSVRVKHPFLNSIKMRFEEKAGIRASSTASTSEDRKDKNEEKRFDKGVEKGQHIVDIRIDMLQKLEGRIDNMKRLTDDQKSALSAALSAQISALTDLKSKIASSTSTSTLIAELKSLRPDLRAQLLVMPRTAIIAAADRITVIADEMAQVAAKLDVRIKAAHDAGTDTSAAESAYTDLNAKVADAKVQAKAASDLVINLNASSTATSTIQANVALLKSARAKLEAARTDLRMAREDMAVILRTVKGKGLGHTATTTASTTTP